MKKQLLLIGLIFGMFTAFSQEVTPNDNATDNAKVDTTATVADDYCPHRIQLRLGGGYSNDVFKKDIFDYQSKCTYTAMAEIGYAYLWHRKVNIGIGFAVGIGHTRPLMRLNDARTITVNDPFYNSGDPEALYDLTYKVTDLKERQRVWAIEVPLTAQLEKKWGKHGIYAELGVKGYFPFSCQLAFPDGIVDLAAIQDDNLKVEMDALEVHLAEQNIGGYSIKTKMRCSIDILGEFGGVFGIARSADFYLGVYASYGFLDITQKNKDLKLTGPKDPRLDEILNGFLNSPKKWNLFQVGLKLGFHFLPCKECGNNKYMRDEKREFMDEMKKKQKEPIIVTNTVQEYYYIVPTISQELLDESANDPAKKKALTELAQSLSNIKILFDLDKDIPKLDDYKRENIKKAADLLKSNPDLLVIVTGYTSPEGTEAHNQDLGYRRAIAVRQHFINNGVPADQITTKNYTAQDEQHKIDIPEKDYKEQRAVIFKIEKK